MRILYNILAYLSIPWVITRLFIRSIKQPILRKRWWQRFGFVPNSEAGCIWFHAVSLGEAIAATELIKQCLAISPEETIVVTNTTATGAHQIQKSFGGQVQQYFVPYDFSGAVKRFIKRAKPKLLVLLETELWPNMIHYAHQAKVPVVLLNARLSARSARGYARVAGLTKNMLQQLTHVAVQAQADRERFTSLGLPEHKSMVTGSVKYDLVVSQATIAAGASLRKTLGEHRPVWIAASTHQGEEEQVLMANQTILSQIPNALLVLVPRHPNRFDQVASLLQKEGLSFDRRSAGDVSDDKQVLLGDTMGEMLLFYAASDVAFVGGSFATTGGHNTLEPAALKLPVLQGPHWHNFVETTELLTAANALIQVDDATALANQVLALFADKARCSAMGERAFGVVEENRGSVAKQFALIQQLLDGETK